MTARDVLTPEAVEFLHLLQRSLQSEFSPLSLEFRGGAGGKNFDQVDGELQQLVDAIIGSAGSRHIYMGSTPTAQLLPRFADENPLPLIGEKPTEPRIWIGNDSVVAPHFDESDNIACVVSGSRRFTLFPPEQVGNLYVGPIDNTVAGQPAAWLKSTIPTSSAFPGSVTRWNTDFSPSWSQATQSTSRPCGGMVCGQADRSTCW